MSTPIAFCYLHKDGDDQNKCILYTDELEIIKDGRSHIYASGEIDFEFTHKKWMLPFAGGWLLLCASLLFVFRNLYNPWLSLTLLLFSVFSIYIGWEGSEILRIKAGGISHLFPIHKSTSNLKQFVRFVHDYQLKKDSQQSLLTIYHLAIQDIWVTQKEEHYYSHPSLKTEGFIHCSLADQLVKTYQVHFQQGMQLMLLAINPLKLTSQLKLEHSIERAELFPHIYGTINKEAIISVDQFSTKDALIDLLKDSAQAHF